MLLGSGESGVGGGPKVAVHLWKIGRLEQPLSQRDHREVMVGVDEPGGAATVPTTGQGSDDMHISRTIPRPKVKGRSIMSCDKRPVCPET